MVITLSLCYLYIFLNFSGDPITTEKAGTMEPLSDSAKWMATPYSCLEEFLKFLHVLILLAEHDHRFSRTERIDANTLQKTDQTQICVDEKVTTSLELVMTGTRQRLNAQSDSGGARSSVMASTLQDGKFSQNEFRCLCRDMAQLLLMQMSLASSAEVLQRLVLHNVRMEGQLTSWLFDALDSISAIECESEVFLTEPLAASDSDGRGAVTRLAGAYNAALLMNLLIARSDDYKYSLSTRESFVSSLLSHLSGQLRRLISCYEARSSERPVGVDHVERVKAEGSPWQGVEGDWHAPRSACEEFAKFLPVLFDFYTNFTTFDFPELTTGLKMLSSALPPPLLRKLVEWYSTTPHLGDTGPQIVLRVLSCVARISLDFCGAYPCDQETLRSLGLLSISDPIPLTTSCDSSAPGDVQENVGRYICVVASVIVALQVYYSGDWSSLPLFFSDLVEAEERGGDNTEDEADENEERDEKKGADESATVLQGQGTSGRPPEPSRRSDRLEPTHDSSRLRKGKSVTSIRKLTTAATLRHLTTDICKFATVQVLLGPVCSQSRKRLMAVFQKFREVTMEVARREATMARGGTSGQG